MRSQHLAGIRDIHASMIQEPVSGPATTKTGKILTEADIQALADEAEATPGPRGTVDVDSTPSAP